MIILHHLFCKMENKLLQNWQETTKQLLHWAEGEKRRYRTIVSILKAHCEAQQPVHSLLPLQHSEGASNILQVLENKRGGGSD